MNTAPQRQFRVRLHRAAALLALGCLLLRAFIPLGYMPGNLLAGEFMVLCPTGLPARAAHALHQHHDVESATVEADQACPIGSALQYAALPTAALVFAPVEFSLAAPDARPDIGAGLKPLRRFQARAPPVVRILICFNLL